MWATCCKLTSFFNLIWPMHSPSEKKHCNPRQSAMGSGQEEEGRAEVIVRWPTGTGRPHGRGHSHRQGRH